MSVHRLGALCLNKIKASNRVSLFANLGINLSYSHTWTELPQDHRNVLVSVGFFFLVIAAHVHCCELCYGKMLVSVKRGDCCMMGCLFSYRQPAELFIWLCNLAGWHSLGTPSL